jgi:hypothetical protein
MSAPIHAEQHDADDFAGVPPLWRGAAVAGSLSRVSARTLYGPQDSPCRAAPDGAKLKPSR